MIKALSLLVAACLLAGAANAEIATVSRDSRLRIDTESGNYLRAGGYFQFRYITAYREQASAGQKDVGNGFQMRRAKFALNGALLEGDLEYKMQFRANSLGFIDLEDAFAKHTFDNGVTVKAGQFKPQLYREENISATKQLAADRTLASRVFRLGYTQGIEFSGNFTDTTRWASAFSDGAGGLNSPVYTEADDFAVSAKLEHSPTGQFRRFRDYTSFRGTNEGKTDWLFGLATYIEPGGDTVGSFNVDRVKVIAEASVEGDGFNSQAAFIGRQTDPGSGDSFFDSAFIVQGGAFVSDQTELFARYESIIPGDDNPRPDTFDNYTVGANYYVVPGSQAAKFTVDVQFMPNATAGALVSPSPTTGVLQTESGSQVQLRIQLFINF